MDADGGLTRATVSCCAAGAGDVDVKGGTAFAPLRWWAVWWLSVRRTLPLLALGALRLWSLRGANYQSHVSEYGVHWNFFFTLALVSLLSTALLRGAGGWGVRVRHCGSVAVALLFLHQTALSTLGLTHFVLHAPRHSWVQQNREGIVSVVGYLALHLLGLRIGAHIHHSQRQPTVHSASEPTAQGLRVPSLLPFPPPHCTSRLLSLRRRSCTGPTALAGVVVDFGKALQ